MLTGEPVQHRADPIEQGLELRELGGRDVALGNGAARRKGEPVARSVDTEEDRKLRHTT